MKIKKVLCMATVISVLVGSLLTGCGNGSTSSSSTASDSSAVSPSSTASSSSAESSSADTSTSGSASDVFSVEDVKVNKEPAYTLTHYVDFSFAKDNFGKTDVGKFITEQTGVTVDVQVPLANSTTKLQTMIATNDLPDLITIDATSPNIGILVKNDLVYDINPLITQYAPEIKKNVEPEYFQYSKYLDGNNYYFTNFIATKFSQSAKGYRVITSNTNVLKMREDIWEAIGKPDTTNPDKLFDALMKIKQQFPKVKPFSMLQFVPDDSFFKYSESEYGNQLLGQFGLTRYTVDEGTVKSSVRDPKFLSCMTYLNKLFTNGLLDRSSFVDDATVAKTKVTQGNFGVFTAKIGEDGFAVTKGHPELNYVALPFFETANFKKASAGWLATLVTKKAKDVKRVMEYINYMESPMGKAVVSNGILGRDWNIGENGLPNYSQEFKDAAKKDSNYPNSVGTGIYWAFMDDYYSNIIYNTDNPNFTQQQMDEWQTKYAKQVNQEVFLGKMDPVGGTPEGTILAKLHTYAQQSFPKMVMAKDQAECESIYNEFIKKCDSLGLPEVERVWTEKYKLYSK